MASNRLPSNGGSWLGVAPACPARATAAGFTIACCARAVAAAAVTAACAGAAAPAIVLGDACWITDALFADATPATCVRSPAAPCA